MDVPLETQRDEKTFTEDAFQLAVRELGGQEKMYLVGSVCDSESVSQANVFEEFVKDMFNTTCPLRHSRENANKATQKGNNSLNGKAESIAIGSCCESETHSGLVKAVDHRRAQEKKVHHRETARLKPEIASIDSPMIVFIFKHEFINSKGNHACLKEILKDVKARTKLSSIRPALLGLVRTALESEEAKLSVTALERLMRSVFRKHPFESIWVGQFVPNKAERTLTIKKNVCRTLQTSLHSECAEDRTLPWALQCLPWTPRERHYHDKNTSGYRHRDPPESAEGLPLRMSCMKDGQGAEQ
ncbi:hypothetical protein AGOR_G00242770 [Albula goreensis]|uniref:C2orf72-like C-terminal domain-containing protein n=1 Tax=Albula goreensis TaxID=1534307 RepID=A0A8T3CGP4_9TELE|nr:hypothetical protein AGOR_G00242770 [Albula goreensis]